MKRSLLLLAALGLGAATAAQAAPATGDRVYTADQNSNTVSVIDPAGGGLLGQIRLGNPRPDVLSPLYKGEINVHGLGFSPDHRTLVAVSTGSNSATFIDTATNRVKGVAYIGRSPHEGFFTPDGREVWVTVRGEDYLSVINPVTFKEIRRIPTTSGPGMVIFGRDGRHAFVANSFNPVVEVVEVATHRVVKRIPVVSPFSPFIQLTPDGREVWLTHKDVGKVTRIDTATLEVSGVFDTGFITNHLAFGRSGGRTLAYVTVGGENLVKVFTMEDQPKLVASIPVGALPHGVWASDDRSRLYVGLENGDAVEVIDAERNAATGRIPVGQAPQALVYLSGAVPEGDDRANLAPRPEGAPNLTLALAPPDGNAAGFLVSRGLGLVDAVEVNLFRLKPETVYRVYLEGQGAPLLALRTNDKGMASATAIGPVRAASGGNAEPAPSQVVVLEGETAPSDGTPVLASR
ncbi:YncE family protein [Azospirillum sp. SYSU D00513]|uniref:YncE family protein n=1 Tax=Azospirillum sp. SYSU D00513 TaxID=2812561 RepID=UPI001A96F418|nr:YncE family protein [Azospirillum sp. SYSU D00513]